MIFAILASQLLTSPALSPLATDAAAALLSLSLSLAMNTLSVSLQRMLVALLLVLPYASLRPGVAQLHRG